MIDDDEEEEGDDCDDFDFEDDEDYDYDHEIKSDAERNLKFKEDVSDVDDDDLSVSDEHLSVQVEGKDGVFRTARIPMIIGDVDLRLYFDFEYDQTRSSSSYTKLTRQLKDCYRLVRK